ncbi:MULTISPECIES: hypothetical protein [unclassified Cupriavidus]|uniref:hypothetical protein n=1 Tax=Cupriavidus sp. H19C3 TaxID=3241603 RepID=UPI003BF8989C
MQGIAVLLGLVAAACLYLAAPNQVLIPPARLPLAPRVLGWLGLALTVASAWIMSVAESWGVAIAAALVTLTCSLSLWPFLGTWAHQRRGARHPRGSRGASDHKNVADSDEDSAGDSADDSAEDSADNSADNRADNSLTPRSCT